MTSRKLDNVASNSLVGSKLKKYDLVTVLVKWIFSCVKESSSLLCFMSTSKL